MVIGSDEPDLGPLALGAAWGPLGFELLLSDVLARSGPPPQPDTFEYYVLHEIEKIGRAHV